MGKNRNDAAFGEEDVVGVAEAAASLKGYIVGTELGEGNNLLEWEILFGCNGASSFGVGVISDEAKLGEGGVEGVESVGKGNSVGLDAGSGTEASDADVEVDEVVMLQ